MLWIDCLFTVHMIYIHTYIHTYQHETKQEVDVLKKSDFGYPTPSRAYPRDMKYVRGSLKASPVEGTFYH
jgi:hypothetical protein